MDLKTLKLQIKQECKDIPVKNDKTAIVMSNKILDVFESHYAKLLRENNTDYKLQEHNPDYESLKDFIMFFINGKFQKQLKFNIWVAMAFYKQSEVTRLVINTMREKYKIK